MSLTIFSMHPLSLREISAPFIRDTLFQTPQKPADDALENLLQFGGFPESFVKANNRFHNRWQRLHQQQFTQSRSLVDG